GIRANDWHAELSPAADPEGTEEQNPDNPCPTCPSAPGASMFSLHDGHMSKNFSLPAYRSLESSRALTFSYRSFRAYPRPSVGFNGEIIRRSEVPQTISIELEVAGLEQGQETFLSTTGFSEEQDEPFRVAASFDASDFESGMYDYRLKVTNNFASGTSRSTFIDNRIMIENEVMSPFGAGWMLEGLYRLAINEDDDSVTLLAPAGNSRTYRESGVPGEYDSPDNDYAEFVLNTDGSYTHTEKDGVRMEFDETGLITAHIDRNGNTNSYVYDADGKLETITDPVGLVTTFTYDNNGRLATVTDPAGRVSTFEFDVLGNLTQITYPDNTFETFEYDDRHLMVAHEDENQNRYTDRYDAFGRIIDGTLPDGTVIAATGKTTIGLVDVNSGIGSASNPAPIARPADANSEYVDGRGNPSSKELDRHGRTTVEVDEVGRVTTHIRDTDSNATQTTRPIGSVVTRTFDSFGNVLTQREEFNGATTSYNYDNFSLVTSVTNPRNHTTTINRDPATGNPLSIVNDLGHTTTMTYNSQGLVETMTSPNGLVTSYTYNAQGLMETNTETPPAGSPGNVRVWSYSYFPTGLLQTVNTPDGITLNYTYDARSLLTSVTDNLGQQIIYTYDAHKNVIQTETLNSDGSLALLVDSVYDERNRLIETRAPHGQTDESITQRILDANSNLVGLIDPNGNQSTNTYDAFNRLENNIHRESGVTLYEYDDQDRITKVIAPNGVTTEYQYDLISRRTREISPDRGIIQYGYDLANNVVSIIDGRGIEATMTYDELERVSTKTYPNTLAGKNENVTYTYDTCGFGIGYLCTRVDESGSYAYNYDAFGNLTDQTFTEQGGTVYTQSYVYDDGDNMTQMTLPSGRVIDYQRDGVRRVSAIDTTLNGTAQNIVNTIQYRGDNQVTQRTFGNGLIDERTYDLQGRLGSQLLRDSLNNLVDQRLYNYDKNSNVLGIDTNLEDNVYTYDMLDRLTSDNIDTDVPIEFSYDLNDNRLTKALQDTSFDELLTYYANSNRILTTDALQIGASPIPAIPNREMVYNDVGRLFQLIEEGNLKAEYIYNDEGQRTRKTVYQPDGITVGSITIYHYDRMGYLVTETTETGQLIKDYIWQEGMTPVAQIDSNGGSESIVYLHTDHLMTSRLATDQFQFVAWRWEGEAFGNTPAEELTGVSINLRFPGQYYDEEAGLHYNRFRYYDPSLGRYITSDPIGLLAGLNTYNYADANPLKYIDPLGLFSFAGIKREIENASRPIVLCNEYGCGMVGLEARESAYENCVSCEARCVAEFIIPGYEDLVAQGLKQGAKKAASDAAKAGLKFAAKRINIVFTVLDAGLAATCVLECK
ncbi:MAG: RHS repeat-associated core domain-containing protein, partial [Gammaproteobacteria bacterium]